MAVGRPLIVAQGTVDLTDRSRQQIETVGQVQVRVAGAGVARPVSRKPLC